MKIYPIDKSAKKIDDDQQKSLLVYCLLQLTEDLSIEMDNNTKDQ